MPAKKPSPKTPAAKKAATKKALPNEAPAKKAAAPKKAAPVRSGTAGKGEGNAAVNAWIAQVKPEQRALVERLDALLGELIPDVRRAVKWSMPMYGREGQGWIAHIGSYKEYVALGFFLGTQLTPPPPDGESETMRRVKIRSLQDLDEAQVRDWIAQAARLPGWSKV